MEADTTAPSAEGSAPAHPAALDLPPALASPAPSFARLALPDGGFLRHARWPDPAPRRGSVVLLGGRSEFIEKYDEQAQDWRRRGWQVFACDWRGQGLSSRFLADRARGHVPDFGVLAEDLGRYLDQAVRPFAAGALVVFAHSMGAHILLRRLLERPGADGVAAIVLSAPMAALDTSPVPPAPARSLARLACRLGLAQRYAPGQGKYEPGRQRFEDNPLSSDRRRWAIQHRWFAGNPDLRLGGVTWGWLDAAFRSIDALAGMRPASAPPSLLLAAGADRIIPPASQQALAGHWPDCRLLTLPDARHEIMMERDEIRDRAWQAIDAFLDQAAPSGP